MSICVGLFFRPSIVNAPACNLSLAVLLLSLNYQASAFSDKSLKIAAWVLRICITVLIILQALLISRTIIASKTSMPMALLTINYGFTNASQPINKTIKDIQQAYKSQQSDENILPALLLVIKEVVDPLPSKVVPDIRPQEIVNGEEGESKNVAVRWTGTTNGGEEEDLEEGDYGPEEVEV